MFGGVNPKRMQAMMKQMGIGQTEITATRVTIEKIDGGKIVIEPASVTKISMQGQESFQVTGNISEVDKGPQISPEDIKTVMEKTGKSENEAKTALEETGDLAEAIMKLS